MKSADVRRRTAAAAAVLVMNVFLLLAAGIAIGWARNRGVLCDGATVLCSGGDPTPDQWQAEMTFRSSVAYGSYALVALVLLVSAVLAWRRRRNGMVIMQITAVVGVAALAVLWEPYVPLR